MYLRLSLRNEAVIFSLHGRGVKAAPGFATVAEQRKRSVEERQRSADERSRPAHGCGASAQDRGETQNKARSAWSAPRNGGIGWPP